MHMSFFFFFWLFYSLLQPRSATSNTFMPDRINQYKNGTLNFRENTPSAVLAISVFVLAIIVVALCFYCSHKFDIPLKSNKDFTLSTVVCSKMASTTSLTTYCVRILLKCFLFFVLLQQKSFWLL